VQAIRGIPVSRRRPSGCIFLIQQWLNSGVRVRAGSSSRDKEVGTSLNYVTPGYFEALRIPLVAGRVIDERDSDNSEPVVLINETFARMFFKGQDPLRVSSSRRHSTRIVGVLGFAAAARGIRSTNTPRTHSTTQAAPPARPHSRIHRPTYCYAIF